MITCSNTGAGISSLQLLPFTRRLNINKKPRRGNKNAHTYIIRGSVSFFMKNSLCWLGICRRRRINSSGSFINSFEKVMYKQNRSDLFTDDKDQRWMDQSDARCFALIGCRLVCLKITKKYKRVPQGPVAAPVNQILLFFTPKEEEERQNRLFITTHEKNEKNEWPKEWSISHGYQLSSWKRLSRWQEEIQKEGSLPLFHQEEWKNDDSDDMHNGYW